ncbi:MAG: S-adenosylmethionine decarboxylase proenzyme [Leptospiraceae bacterium]|nr:S-adenosylmethionine decarboxylase proenzyme [Leptospiraceae bacterium]
MNTEDTDKEFDKKGITLNVLGKHSIAEYYDCDREIINDQDLIEKLMIEAVEISGATLVKTVFHKFSPHGVTGIVVVAESHFAIHTWPEYGYCAVDIFTCGDVIDNRLALDHIKKQLCAKSVSVLEMKRGILDTGEDIRYKPLSA